MARPFGFSWIEEPRLAGMGRPESVEELHWLREHGIELIVSLSEEPPRRDWVNDAGLLLMHVPVEDMEAPTQEQLEQVTSAIERALRQPMGVVVQCGAGLGRTGTVLAAYLVRAGRSPESAIAEVRRARPGSIETLDQERAVSEFASRRQRA